MQSSTQARSSAYAAPARGRARKQHGSLLRRVVVLLAVVPVGVCMFTEAGVPWTTRSLAAALWVLCLVPAFIYLNEDPRTRRPIPFFPVLSFVFGIYYVLPLTLGVVDNYYNAPVYPETDYDYPVQLVFLGWISMVAAYIAFGLIFVRKKRPAEVAWNPRLLARIGFMLMFGGMAVGGLRTLLFSASSLGGMLQFVLSVQWFGTGILIILARRGELSSVHKVWLRIGFVITAAMLLSAGNIAPMAMFFAVGAFALWVARPYFRPRWILGATLAILTAVSFRGIVIDFRRTIGETPQQLSQRDNLRLMLNLLGQRMNEQGIAGAVAHGLASTAGRSAIMDLFANVARRTPDEVPYWRGETYKSLIGSTVPRILWPDKPTKDLGQNFGHRYALIHATNMSTAINLPILVEFFVNFGGTGVVIGMFIVGLIYRVLDTLVNRPGQSQLLSMIGVVILLPLLLIESDFSLVLGGLPLTGAAFYVVWWRLRKSLGSPVRATASATATAVGGPQIRLAPAVTGRQLPAGPG